MAKKKEEKRPVFKKRYQTYHNGKKIVVEAISLEEARGLLETEMSKLKNSEKGKNSEEINILNKNNG